MTLPLPPPTSFLHPQVKIAYPVCRFSYAPAQCHRRNLPLQVSPLALSSDRSMSATQPGFKELRDESDFESIVFGGGLVSVCGFGSLLSERSARSTFPDLINFRVARLNGFRRLFANAAPIFFERGIAKPETKEISSLCAEPCEWETLIITVFEINMSEIPAFIEREIEFRFLAVVPETLDGKQFEYPAVFFVLVLLMRNSSEFDAKKIKKFIFSIMDDLKLIRFGEMISCLVAPTFDTAKNLGDAVYDNFLDHTFLGDRKTTIRRYLKTSGSGIMEEDPPESLKNRYGG